MKISRFKLLNENINHDGEKFKKIYDDYNEVIRNLTEFMELEKIIEPTNYVDQWWYEHDDTHFNVYVVSNQGGGVGEYHFGDKELSDFTLFINNKEEYINSKKYNL